MHAPHGPVSNSPGFPRRRLIKSAGIALAGIASGRHRGALAESVTGEITVAFDESDTAVAAAVDAARAAVIAAFPEARITVEAAPAGNFLTQLFLGLGTGRGPDVFVTNGLAIGELAAAGYIAPLDPWVDTWDGWAQYPVAIQDAVRFQDHVYALPSVVDTHFLYYRKDLFEGAGLPREWAPSTPDDVLEAARALKAALPDVMPYGLHAGANGGTSTVVRGFVPLTYAYGGELADAEGRIIIDSCAIREALTYYETAYQIDESVPRQAMTAPNVTAMLRDSLLMGELAMLYDGSWVHGSWAASDAGTTATEIGYVEFPLADGTGTFAVGGIGASWYLNARTESTGLAFAMMEAANSIEIQVAMNTASPHIPPRQDAAADPAFVATPFLEAMVATTDHLLVAPPDPAYRQLVGVIQNVTGQVATGEASPDAAIEHYAGELTRILGTDRVVAQPCDRD